jgi:hypothetical protein
MDKVNYLSANVLYASEVSNSIRQFFLIGNSITHCCYCVAYKCERETYELLILFKLSGSVKLNTY